MNVFRNLTFWVLFAILVGIVMGHFYPKLPLAPIFPHSIQFQFLGQEFKIGNTISEFLSGVFISIVKLFINPIIFVTISLGILNMGNLRRVGRLGAKSLLYFEVVTTLALIIGVAVAFVLQPGSAVDLGDFSLGNGPSPGQKTYPAFSWTDFFRSNSSIQVLLIAIGFGIFLMKTKYLNIILWLNSASKLLFKYLHYVMLLAPLGAFGGMSYTIAKYGLASLLPLGKLMVTVYLTMFIFILAVLGGILQYYKISIFRFLRYIREELLIVLGTSSSESALPNLMEKLERMGCSKSVVGLVVPTGYSFNLDGTTIYLSMAIIFLAQVFKVHLDFSQIFAIIGILMITSKGAAGVTGSGFVILASTLTSIKVIPIEGLALLLGVDRFMSEARSITNFIGNGVATIFLANNEGAFDRSKMDYEFQHPERSEDILGFDNSKDF